MKHLIICFCIGLIVSMWYVDRNITNVNERTNIEEKSINSINVHQLKDSLSSSDSTQIRLLLAEDHNKEIEELKIYRALIDTVHLFGNDPGWIEGPSIPINKSAYIISYYTTSRSYRDLWMYEFIDNDSIVIRFNNYHGVGYHGGSRIIYAEFINDRLAHAKKFIKCKTSTIYQIENVLRK